MLEEFVGFIVRCHSDVFVALPVRAEKFLGVPVMTEFAFKPKIYVKNENWNLVTIIVYDGMATEHPVNRKP